jgi:hypothetical protein
MADQYTTGQLVEILRAERQERWQRGDRVLAEEFVRCHPILQSDPERVVELIYHEKLLRDELGEKPQLEEYIQRFPQFAEQLKTLFAVDS